MLCSLLSWRPSRTPGVHRLLLPALFAVAGLGGAHCGPREGVETKAASTQTPRTETVHTGTVQAARGDFIRAVVVQRNDVRVDLIGPDGREVLHVDGPNSIRENEEIAAVAGQAGAYRLEVHNCPPGKAAGCYSARIDALRPATGADRRRAAAVRATQDAVDLMPTPDSFSRQLTARQRSLELWQAAGDRRREAEELYQLGIVERLLAQPRPAAEHLHAAAGIHASLGQKTEEVDALNEAGLSCQDAGSLDHARSDFQQALAKARQTGDREQQKDTLNNLGLLLSPLGEGQEALGHLQEALHLSEELRGSDRANILNSLGFVYTDLGETEKAIRHHKQALDDPGASLADQATAWNNLGTIYSSLGNWEEAEVCYTQAIDLNRTLGNRFRLASTLNNRAVAQHNSGSYAKAVSSYQEALTLARQVNNLDVQIQAANNLGILMNQKLGRPQEALQQWRTVVRLAARQPSRDYVGLAARATMERSAGRLADAHATLQEAISRARHRAELRIAADLTLRLSRLERDMGDLPAAEKHAQEAVETIEAQRDRVTSLEQRALFLASTQAYYESYVRTLMERHRHQPREGWDTRALAVAERARARSLLDLLAESESGLRRGVPKEILDQEVAARARLRELDLQHMELVHRNARPEEIARAAERLRKAVNTFEDVETALRESSGSYAALTTQPLDVRAIQRQVLSDRTLLLEYALGEEKSYLWAVTPGAVQSFELPGRRQIEAAANPFYKNITARNDPKEKQPEQADDRAGQASRQLSRMILGPVEPLLGDHILLVVADGVLQYVPFSALPLPSSPGERVVHHNQVVSLPSASTLAALRRQIQGRPTAPDLLAVLADPVFQDDSRHLQQPKVANPPVQLSQRRGSGGEEDQLNLARLPFAEEEAQNILSLVPAKQRLAALGFDASYSLATSGRLAGFRFVHFATHGLIDSRQPKLSKLALSQYKKDGRPQEESFLRLADIYNLELNADLVTLSACQTALGQDVRGEGLVGLTRGFMYAGAARVLASLWSVEDRATAKLMKSFYRHLLVEKLPAADALRRAQLELSKEPRYASPYYWAGFSLQGEWQ